MTSDPSTYVGKNGVTYQLAEHVTEGGGVLAKSVGGCGCSVDPLVRDCFGVEYVGYPWWARLLIPSLRGSPGCGCFARLRNWWDELHIHLEPA